MQADVRGDVQREGRLAHRRARGDEDEIGGLQAARQAVEVLEARRQARDAALRLVEHIDALERAHEDALDGLEAIRRLRARHGEDLLLSRIHDALDGLCVLVGGAGDFRRGVDEAAQLGLLLDDLRVVRDIGRRRHDVGDRRDERDAADLLELAVLAQLLGQRDEVDCLVVLGELQHRIVDTAVRLAVEVLRLQDFLCLDNRLFLDHHRAEDRLFRLNVLRRHALW